MKRFIILLFSILIAWNTLSGQAGVQWAGPDTVSCGEKGVVLGVTTPCPGCCFTWSPVTGLDDPHIQNPTARPKEETIYSVVVTDQYLSWKKTDEVKVGLTFGELHFIPDHLEQGTEEFALAKLMKNNGNAATTWSFASEDLGCMLEPISGDNNHARIYPGDEYGKLLVKVRKNSDTACFFIDTLPVNNGVKDLKVIDLNTPARMATTGQTLHLVSNDPADWKARLIAIPNEGGFAAGIPDYRQDLYATPVPIDGEDDQVVEDIASPAGKISDYIAGDFPEMDPSVRVIRKIPVESTSGLPALLNNLYSFWESIEFEIDFDNGDHQLLGEAPGTPPGEEPLCSAPDPFSMDFNFSVVWKEVDVEKFGSPDLGVKKECGIDCGIASSGRLYHPYFTRHITLGGVGACTELFVGYDATAVVHLNMASDESMEDASWTANNPQLELAFSGVAGFGATLLSGTGYNLTSSGSGAASVKAFIEYQKDTRNLVTYAKLLPLTIKIEATIVSETNMGDTLPLFNLLSKEIVLYKGFEFPPVTLFTFP